MEWNAKSPLHWDWDNLVVFSAKPTEFSGNNCNEAGSPCSFGGDFARGSGRPGFGSDLKRESSLKSSKSTSVDSSSIVKTPDFTIETFEGTPGDCRGKKEMARTNLLSGSSLVIEASVGSDEQLIGLKLGKRTYFGNSSDGSNNKASFNMVPVSSESTTKRSRSSYQSMQFPRCQVEGCYLDLSSAKDYHRKHRICENHAKCPRVIVNGLELRFCQQCSRFHSLPEFDEKKRSCRKRLSDHNARRRKPRQEANHFSAARVSSSFYDRRQQMGFITDQFPFHDTNSTADNTLDCNFARTKQYTVIPKEIGGASKLHSTSNVLPSAVETLSKSSNMYVSAKGVTTKILNEDLEESTLSSNMVAAQDLHRALSLLSTNSWASSHPNPMRMNHATCTNSIAHTQPHVETQAFSLACPEFWEIDQHSSDSQSHMLNSQTNESSHFQENQLLKTHFLAGYDNGRYI